MNGIAADPDRLYNLMPLVDRERDAAAGYPLRAMLRLVGAQADLIEQDIRTLYDDLFIETCRDWVIPYIGDLVSNQLLFDSNRVASAETAQSLFADLTGTDLRAPVAIRTRADVAKTIYFRRRKGTLPMLEELARDVTGWPAHAVEFFQLLGWTQFREHLRPQARWVDIRTVERVDRINGPFDEATHTVDVRHVAQDEGWHNIPNVGFFLFRLASYLLRNVPARVAGQPWRYHFSPLGNKAPLFSRWRREGNASGLATELHVPVPIRPPFFFEDLQAYRNTAAPPARPDFTSLYGLPDPLPGQTTGVCPECSLFVIRNGVPMVPAQDPAAPPAIFQPQVICRRLDPWPAAQPVGRLIAVDVASGRIAIGDGFADATERVDVYYHYGFSADMGGGPYDRQKWLLRPDPSVIQLFVREGATLGPTLFPSVIDALNEWELNLARANTVITILDSRTYRLPSLITLRNEGFLAIEAANSERPLLETQPGGLVLSALPPAVAGDEDRSAALTLSGVVVEGHIEITGDLGRLRLLHSTLAPGRSLDEEGAPVTNLPSILVASGPPGNEINEQLRLEIAYSLLGAVEMPQHAAGIWLLDTIVDALSDMAFAIGDAAGAPSPDLTVERSTIVGQVHARSLELSESIVTGRIETVRTQHGCARFSYVQPGSRTPRRYRCQPDLASAKAVEDALARNPTLSPAAQAQIRTFVEGRLVPAFTTLRYGQPAYAQLRLTSPVEIRTGSEDGSEMGAFSQLKQPQRESNLRIRLEEYLPFGLEPGVLYAT
jgi:hypothetical protein